MQLVYAIKKRIDLDYGASESLHQKSSGLDGPPTINNPANQLKRDRSRQLAWLFANRVQAAHALRPSLGVPSDGVSGHYFSHSPFDARLSIRPSVTTELPTIQKRSFRTNVSSLCVITSRASLRIGGAFV
jgi:hypothetical protein